MFSLLMVQLLAPAADAAPWFDQAAVEDSVSAHFAERFETIAALEDADQYADQLHKAYHQVLKAETYPEMSEAWGRRWAAEAAYHELARQRGDAPADGPRRATIEAELLRLSLAIEDARVELYMLKLAHAERELVNLRATLADTRANRAGLAQDRVTATLAD